MHKWKKCCANEIKRMWDTFGSENIIRYVVECPKCKHFIGLTQTTKKEANKFLKQHNLTN